VLYNDLCRQLLLRVIHKYEFKGTVEIVIDRFLTLGRGPIIIKVP
jgi:hypothetical protein